LQTVTLLDAITEFGFDACIGGARRDEEKARAKERVFSFRDAFGQWDPRRQRPELWNLYNGRLDAGEHMRVFPISNWTELDVWQYIAREEISLPPLYYAHSRSVAVRGNILLPVADVVELRPEDRIETRVVRFRTVGDISCTLPVESAAADVQAIIAETLTALVSERGATRLDDQASDSAMEDRKKAGYF
jgi:sulfate adenylyltransferase subunit 2